MSNWFDERAKSSARSTSSDLTAVHVDPVAEGGLSRRDVLKRGGIVAGVAWTAPVLMSVMTPAAATTACPAGMFSCPADDTGPHLCCDLDDGFGNPDICSGPDASGAFRCINPGELGGLCKNEGSGTSGCFQGGNTSIHCNNGHPNICGGIGAQCEADRGNIECAPPLVCVEGAGRGGQDACVPA